VELPEGLQVLGMLTGCALDDIRIDTPVELTLEALYTDEEGRDVLTYKYAPRGRGMRAVYVLGVGAHPWGKFPDKPQLQLAVEALTAALGDAGVAWRDLQGVVQVRELAWQLRGQAGGRQVPNPLVGQSAVLGLGANGASVVLKV
jgi:hypothetical protein